LSAGRGFPSGQRGGTQDPLAQAFEGSNPSPRTKDEPPKIVDGFIEFLKTKDYQLSTIETKWKLIKILSRKVSNLWDSDSVRDYIKRSSWGNKRKNNVGYAYRDWCTWKGFNVQMDYFKEDESPLPYIPRETEIDQLISGCNANLACFLQVMKETAFRPGEVLRLTVSNVDIEKRVITLNKPEKRSSNRQARISLKLTSMIIPILREKKPLERLWTLNYDSICQTFLYSRRHIALKVANPSLERITFKTFRHWKATMEYHRTKDILYVKELLGHKSLKNTLVYTHLVSFEEENAFIVKVASTIEEFTTLLESGFEFVSDYQNLKVCRKRK